jgi:hypothetical protein
LNVTKKTLDRADNPKGTFGREDRPHHGIKSDRQKPFQPGALGRHNRLRDSYPTLGASDASSVERYTKTLKLDALKSAAESELLVGDYHIGGHLHGTSTEHVDQLVGWKITIDLAGKKTDFTSGLELRNAQQAGRGGTFIGFACGRACSHALGHFDPEQLQSLAQNARGHLAHRQTRCTLLTLRPKHRTCFVKTVECDRQLVEIVCQQVRTIIFEDLRHDLSKLQQLDGKLPLASVTRTRWKSHTCRE